MSAPREYIEISDEETDEPIDKQKQKPDPILIDSDSDIEEPPRLEDTRRHKIPANPPSGVPSSTGRSKESSPPLQRGGTQSYIKNSLWDPNRTTKTRVQVHEEPFSRLAYTSQAYARLSNAPRPGNQPHIAQTLPHLPQTDDPLPARLGRGQPLPLKGSSTTSSSPPKKSSFATAFKSYAPLSAQTASVDGLLDGNAPGSASVKTPSKSQFDSQSRLVCVGCEDAQLRCDGAKPTCSRCKELGLACAWTYESFTVQQVRPIGTSTTLNLSRRSAPDTPTNLESTARPSSTGGPKKYPSGSPLTDLKTPDTSPATKTKIVLRVPHSQGPSPKQAVEDTYKPLGESNEEEQMQGTVESGSGVHKENRQSARVSVSSGISIDHDGPTEVQPTIEAVTKLLEDLRKQMHAWQESSTQAQLRQATLDARKRPQPESDKTLSDPFKSITEQRRAAVTNPHDLMQKKKVTTIRAPVSSFLTGAVLLPKYKAIGRISSSMLATNQKTSKYHPYSADDERDPDGDRKYADWQQHYNIDLDRLKDQRHCQELVWLWKPWVEDLITRLGLQISDVLYYFASEQYAPQRLREVCTYQPTSCKECGSANLSSRRDYCSSKDFNLLPPPDDRKLLLTSVISRALHDIAGISLWHIATGGLLQPRYNDQQPSKATQSNLCLICFRHYCPDHGSYEETNATIDESFINDSEQRSNVRKFVALPDKECPDKEKVHSCGLFCVQPSSNLRRLIGRQPDGSVRGEFRTSKDHIRPILGNDELCCTSCFWDVNNRRDTKASEVNFQPFLSASQKALVETMMPFYLNNQRGPCLISRVIKDVDCLMVFNHIIFTLFNVPHPEVGSAADTSDTSGARHGSDQTLKKKRAIYDVSKSAELGNRPLFLPCSHEGPCHSSPECSCTHNKVHCERFCGCDQSCKRRFGGCICKASGKKICFGDSRCNCWANSRECDPELCGTCGVVEVLESSNKYRDEIRISRCRNNRIQLGLPAPTTKAPSQVQGYGLYSRAEMVMGDFIGEYTGEIIGRSEGNRRGTIYHLINQEYLFNLNLGQEIDASNSGNKMRFMNDSEREENINVEAKSLLCNGAVRLGLFAKREIRAGEELLWRYGYSAELVKFFWEPGEKRPTDRALIPFSNQRLARNTGRNKLAGESSRGSRDGSTQSTPVYSPQKRKRRVIESPEQQRIGRFEDDDEEVAEESAGEVLKIPEVDDSDDSDYNATNGHASASEDDGDDLEDDSDEEPLMKLRAGANLANVGTPKGGGRNAANSTSSPSSRRKQDSEPGSGRKRQLSASDKRIGGKSQQQGWNTRKRNLMNSHIGQSPK